VDRQQRAVSVQVSVRGACLSLRAHLPEAYPAREPPLVEVDGPNATQTITNFALKAIQDHFVPGEAVLYGWIEAVREHLEDVLPEEAAPASLDGQIAAASRLEVAVETGVPPYANSIYFQCFNPTGCGLKKLRGIAPP